MGSPSEKVLVLFTPCFLSANVGGKPSQGRKMNIVSSQVLQQWFMITHARRKPDKTQQCYIYKLIIMDVAEPFISHDEMQSRLA